MCADPLSCFILRQRVDVFLCKMYRGVFAFILRQGSMFSYEKCTVVYLRQGFDVFLCKMYRGVFAFILRQGSMFSYKKCTVVYLLTLPSVANAYSCVLTLCPVSFYVKDRCFHMKNVLWCICLHYLVLLMLVHVC
jgi:hypothetical protein